MLEKWQNLLTQLKIINPSKGWEIWSDEELQLFEYETDIILPLGYKEFCRVFGTGEFGDYMRIHCPNFSDSYLFINSIKDEIDQFSYGLVGGDNLNTAFLNKLLDSAFMFGDNASSDIVFWDLRTYSESDKSYDIYLANSDCFDGIYKIGRDFYDFVQNFCLAMKSYEVLPELKRPEPENITLTFSPFKVNSRRSDFWMQNQWIWQKNIADKIVIKMAQTYEKQDKLLEALLLYIQCFKIGVFGSESAYLSKTFKHLQKELGETQFRAICQAAYCPFEELLKFINTNSLDNQIVEPQLANFEIENSPAPDAKFAKVWQDFLQSVQERLVKENASKIKECPIKLKQIQSEICPHWQEFLQLRHQ